MEKFRNNIKKTTSLLLVFMLLLTLVPFGAMAEKGNSVNVWIRIEGKDKPIVEYQSLEVEPYDISYINGIEKDSNIVKSEKPLAIHAIVKALENANVDVKDEKTFKLNNFDGGYFVSDIAEDKTEGMAGWMYKINGEIPLVDLGSYELEDNDIIELYYVPDYTNYYFTELKANKESIKVGDNVTFTLSAKKEDWEKVNPIEPLKDSKVMVNGEKGEYITDEKGQVNILFEKAGTYFVYADKKLESGSVVRPRPIIIEVKGETKIDSAVEKALNWTVNSKEMSQWDTLILARAKKEVLNKYVNTFKKEIVENNGHYRNVTDYCKMSIIGTSLGMDATDLYGHNFVEKIYNNEKMTNQGLNGPIWALIALDSKGYAIPENGKWNRGKLVNEILNSQNDDGGFGLTDKSGSDVDITAMTLQALSNYLDNKDVKSAVEGGLEYLSKNQQSDGGYNSKWAGDSSESVSQVIIALTSLNIDPAMDARFIKDNNLIDKLLSYQGEDGGFKHLKGEGSTVIPTEQALRALVSYQLFLNGEGKLYVMNDEVPAVVPKVEKVEKVETFADMEKASKWAVPNIIKAKAYGLMDGKGDNNFKPKDNITRAEFATLLVRFKGYETKDVKNNIFKDVKPNAWYYNAVMKAYEEGIIKGKGENIFAPNEPITREEMAVMLARLIDSEEDVEVQEIKDISKASSWAMDSINVVYKLGIMTGSNGNFEPENLVSREMAATTIVRIYELNK